MVAEEPGVSPNGRYTVAQAAEALGVSRSRMNDWVREGVFRERHEIVTRRPVRITGRAIRRVWSVGGYRNAKALTTY